jgi:signal transduction histidine kinase
MRLGLSKREVLPLVAALVVSLTATAAALSTWRQARLAELRLQGCMRLMLGTTQIVAMLVEADAAQRAYRLSGDGRHLAPYHSARERLPLFFRELREVQRRSRGERTDLEGIKKLAERKLNLTREVLTAYRADDVSLLRSLNPAGVALMDEVRGAVRRRHRAWLNEIAALTRSVEETGRVSLVVVVTGAFGTAVLMAIAALQLDRNVARTRLALGNAEKAEKRYKALAQRLQRVREEESGQLARRVHDELGQALTAVRFDLCSFGRKIERVDPALHAQLRKTIDLTDEAVKIVRHIAVELRPAVLDQLGLPTALEWLGLGFQKRYGIRVRMNTAEQTVGGERDQHLALFRIAQEALTNVARHAHASRVSMALRPAQDGLEMEVCDNGVGIPHELLERPRSVGLLSMHERAELAGGRCEILSGRGEGTTVRVTLPVFSPQSNMRVRNAQAGAGGR